MNVLKSLLGYCCSSVVLLFLIGMSHGSYAETLDDVHKKALKEGGVLNCYCSLA